MDRDDVVTGIKRSMRIGPDVDLDAYADHDEAAHIRSAAEYEQAVWDHMHRPPHVRGGLLPWSKTHTDIQVRPGELSIWAGKRGDGKSLITSQVALSLLEQGQHAVIASMEMPIEDTLERMERQAIGVDSPSREYHRRFYEWADRKLWMYEQGGVVPARRVLGLCRYSINVLRVRNVVIDSLMMIGFGNIKSQFDKIELQGQFARDLSAIAKDTGAHIHMVTHMRKGDGSGRPLEADDVKGGGDITDVASMVYVIQGNRRKRDEQNLPEEQQERSFEPDVWLKVEKNRRGPTGGNYGLWLHEQSLQMTGKQGEKMQIVRDMQ